MTADLPPFGYPGMVKADIDRAILANTTEKGFWKTLREMGYELYLYKKNGELRDRPSIRAPFADKNIRLSTLGDGYSPEQITQRILQNVQKQYPFPDATAEARKRLRYRPEKYPKAKGIYALYLRYCYELHIIVKHPTSVKRVSSFLREDVIRLDRLTAEARLLGRTGITTAEELNAYRDEKNGQIPVLSAERTMLRNQLKQAVRNGDEPAAADIRARIAQISGELKTLRKEVSLCENIAIRSGRIKENLAALGQEQNKIEGKELETDEHIRRSSGSGRENDAKRR